ncbi:MAG: hypothetical protein E6554_04730 [Bacteroides sp.]|nr:hypothetical protein [Bacteroides eggerthii]MDU6394327.1 hypothetical protein [Bacteroides sp.]
MNIIRLSIRTTALTSGGSFELCQEFRNSDSKRIRWTSSGIIQRNCGK